MALVTSEHLISCFIKAVNNLSEGDRKALCDVLDCDADIDIDWSEAISGQSDNLLEVRNGKLYYGIEPEPNIATMYVANSGNDSNSGSRASPIRTLDEALERQKNAPVNYSIRLKSGDTFVWPKGTTRRPLSSYRIETYGDPKYGDRSDGTWGSCLVYRPYAADDYTRATIELSTFIPSGSTSSRVSTLTADSLKFEGIKFTYRDTETSVSVMGGNEVWITRATSVQCGGCEFDLKDVAGRQNDVTLSSTPTFILEAVNSRISSDKGLVRSMTSIPSVSVIGIRNSQGGQTDGCGVNTPYTPQSDDYTNITGSDLSNLIRNPDWDQTTGATFNFNVAWDPR